MSSFFMSRKTNEELALAARTDKRAFEELYRRMVDRAFGYFKRRTGSVEDAEDLTQVLFVKLYHSLDHYRDTGVPFEAWFFRIARNVLIDHVRATKTHEELDDATIADGQRDPIGDLSDRLALEEAVRMLPKSYQDVIHFAFFEGLTGKELAYALGVSEENARVLKHRAVKALGKLMASDEQ